MISGSTTAAFGEIASRRESASHSTTFFFQYRPLIALELSSYLFHRQALIYYLALPLSLALLFAYLLYSPQVFVCIFLMRSPVSPYCVCDFIASPRGSLLHGTDQYHYAMSQAAAIRYFQSMSVFCYKLSPLWCNIAENAYKKDTLLSSLDYNSSSSVFLNHYYQSLVGNWQLGCPGQWQSGIDAKTNI